MEREMVPHIPLANLLDTRTDAPGTHGDAPRGATMRTVLRIFTRDLKRILHNPAAIVIALGVCIIPSLYAWTNIIANDDPYRNTSTIPIAVGPFIATTRRGVV